MEIFLPGLHRPAVSHMFDYAFISANRLWDSAPVISAHKWVMDSGAFDEIFRHGRYRHSVEDYAHLIRKYQHNEGLLAAVAQDYMCERMICAKVLGIPESELTDEMFQAQVLKHQEMTIERYDALMRQDVGGVYIMPVLQGFEPEEYVRHLRMYGNKLAQGAWVGVGSVCKRQGDPTYMLAVLEAIHAERPDLRLHGFGVKLTALKNPRIAELFYSADSMAWSFASRKRWGDPNSVRAAMFFETQVREAVGLKPGFLLSAYISHYNRQGTTMEREAAKDGEKARRSREGLQRTKNNIRIMDLTAEIWKEVGYAVISRDEAASLAVIANDIWLRSKSQIDLLEAKRLAIETGFAAQKIAAE